MLYNLLEPYKDEYHIANLFSSLTFRCGLAVFLSLAICFIIGPKVINWLKSKQGEGQPIRDCGPESHQSKKGTPTMGGVMILISVLFSTLMLSDLDNRYIYVLLLVTFGYGAIGFYDDYLKLTKRSSAGLRGRYKLILQVVIAFTAAYLIEVISMDNSRILSIPVFKEAMINLGLFYFPFVAIVVVGSSNAVNLTDGLDGLAIVPIMIASCCFAIISYLVGHAFYAEYLQLIPVKGAGEISIFCSALLGAGLGFLWFNAPPAKVFMGDTGSLAFGGALGTIAVITKHEIVLSIIGGVFVLEAVSVILQVASFKLTGKRIFRMAPIHHHYEKLGWSEPTVVIRFWIIAIIFAILGMSTLKIR